MNTMKLLYIVIVIGFSFDHGHCKHSNKALRRNSLETSMEYNTKLGNYLTIPVIMHFDKALTDRLLMEYKVKTRKKLKEIAKSILKEVESYFRHPSLNQTIHFSLHDTRFLRKNTIGMDENGSNYLRKYCTWQGERKIVGKRWWYSILLTGLDIFYINGNGEEVRTSTGRGYMGGFCTKTKSCTLLEWNPSSIGYLLAHEIGHSLGMTHDGTPHNTCRPHSNIMSNKYHPRYHPKTWSKCSKTDLQMYLKSKRGRCFRKSHGY